MESSNNHTKDLLDECKDIQNKVFELIKKEKGIDFEKMSEIKDPVSEIVKDVNTLNSDQQEFLMHYIKGYSKSSRQNKNSKK